MRLTLRTLLAYLDDTLDPAQAKAIGQKVAESDTAQELIARIKQVTRRRRLTTPGEGGAGGKIDANTVAEYLDNTLDADGLAEVEQTALASDVHLAEIAACHQILTLVLGEPALVPPTARKRMYGLVKGREAIHSRRPPVAQFRERELEPVESQDVDETLRMGLPALRRDESWKNQLVVLGGAAGLLVCLGVAIWMLLPRTGGDGPRRDSTLQARADDTRRDTGKKDDPPRKDGQKPADQTQKTDEAKKSDEAKKTDNGKSGHEGKTTDAKKADDGKTTNGKKKEESGEVPPGPPSTREIEVAGFDAGKVGTPRSDLLVQEKARGKGEWVRLDRDFNKRVRVWTNRPLVSLPGFQSKITTDTGLRITLAGSMFEFNPSPPPLFESSIILHAPPERLDADFTLSRGRVFVANTKDRQARFRLRFENTTDPTAKEIWDVTLEGKDAEVALERWGGYPPGEPFHDNPKDPVWPGPVSDVALVVIHGAATVRADDVTYSLSMPGPAVLVWNSRGALKGPLQMKAVPPHLLPDPPLPKNIDPKLAEALQSARDEMRLATKKLGEIEPTKVDTGLMKAVESGDRSEQKLAVRCYAALDMVPKLIEALGDPKFPNVRLAAIEATRYWSGLSRENDYKFFKALQGADFTRVDAHNIMSLLHSFPVESLYKSETYDYLIDSLASKNRVIRELAHWHLAQIVPEGRKIGYNAHGDERMIEAAHAAWRKLIPPGKLPPGLGKAPMK